MRQWLTTLTEAVLTVGTVVGILYVTGPMLIEIVETPVDESDVSGL
jgi:hypothetical protein